MSNKLSLKPKQFEKLLRQWGAEEIRGGSSGHSKWRIEGKTITTTGKGRATYVPRFAAVLAAEAVGVSVQDFLAGPKTKGGL